MMPEINWEKSRKEGVRMREEEGNWTLCAKEQRRDKIRGGLVEQRREEE